MATVEIYTRPMCGFCYQVKKLFDNKGISYVEYDVWADGSKKAEMMDRSGGRTTMPQIFVNGDHVGDCSETLRANAEGRLDRLLA